MPEANLVFFLSPGGGDASLKGMPETPQLNGKLPELAGGKFMYVGKLKSVDKEIACIFVVLKLSYMAAIGRTNCGCILIVSNLKSQPNQALQS